MRNQTQMVKSVAALVNPFPCTIIMNSQYFSILQIFFHCYECVSLYHHNAKLQGKILSKFICNTTWRGMNTSWFKSTINSMKSKKYQNDCLTRPQTSRLASLMTPFLWKARAYSDPELNCCCCCSPLCCCC